VTTTPPYIRRRHQTSLPLSRLVKHVLEMKE
jgi:hypothetical protein